MIVRAGTFYDGTLDAARSNVHITLQDGKIASIVEATGDYDMAAACVTPGLINAHVHAECSGEPDTMAAIAAMPHNMRVLTAVQNAQKSLRAGVTTIRDVGSSLDIAPTLKEAIGGGKIVGPRMSAAGYALCMTGGHGWFLGREVDGPWDAVKAVREQRLAGADCIKLIATGGVLTKGAVPGLAQLTEEEMRAACTEAGRHQMRVAAHAIGTEGIKNALRAGVTSIEHGHMLDDEAIELFKANNAYLVPTLSAPTCILEHLEQLPEFVQRKGVEVAEHMRANIVRAWKAGVKVAGGSDAGTPYNYHEDYWHEVELMHTILGMTPQQALHAATQVAGELVNIGTGTLRAGDPADLLLLERDAGRDIRALREPAAVIKAGAIVSVL